MWISILKRWIKRFFIKNIVNEPKEISLPFEPGIHAAELIFLDRNVTISDVA
jgi:hypothetical protein